MAIELGQAESAHMLFKAGCRFETHSDWGMVSLSLSRKVAIVIATHLSQRRLQLLKVAQSQLGLFLGHNSVAFADSVAGEICGAFDTVDTPLHPSICVWPEYRSIYFDGIIPFQAFSEFWKMGFCLSNSHDLGGLTPVMTNQTRWLHLLADQDVNQVWDTMSWLSKHGFMKEKPNDPRDLGLNVSATGYHYTGAIVGHFLPLYLPDFTGAGNLIRFLAERSSNVTTEDNCMCWCNLEGHGCSPIKLFLKTCIRGSPYFEPLKGTRRHILLHCEVYNTSNRNLFSILAKEALRLLTFEALEMVHTCCFYDVFDEAAPSQVSCSGSFNDKVILCQDADSILEVRSRETEQAAAALLEDLLAEFTPQLQCLAPTFGAFEKFIYTYWRRRISELYRTDPEFVDGLRQHQAFQGFGRSSTVRTGEYLIKKKIGNCC
jgi:hypothetical protein